MKGVIMFERFRKKKTSILDEPIGNILTQMNKIEPGSKEYSVMVDQLERLTKARAEEARPQVNSDTWAIVAGNLLGILIIVAYEQKHVMVSKGLGFVIKPRDPHI
jgi:hypothetical protein